MSRKSGNAGFDEDIRSTISLMKTVMRDILLSLGISPDNPRDVYKKLNIDKKLGWKIFNVVAEEDPFLAARFVPGRAACRKFMKLCRKLGTADDLLRKAGEACRAFDRMVDKHADSRKEFDLMLMSCSDKGKDKAYLSQQKAGFNAYSHLLGVQADTQLCTWVFCPSSDGEFHDVVSIRGFLDFRRNRPHVPWLLEWAYFTDDDDVPKDLVRVEPLEDTSRGGADEVPFYSRFCSEPLPEVVSSRRLEGRVVHELQEAPIGNTEAVTCITAQKARNVFSSCRTDRDRYREVLVRARTPVERLVFDQIVHRDLAGPEAPELFVFGEFTGYDWSKSAERRNPGSLLPVDAKIQELGFGAGSAGTPHIPWYTEMLEDVFARLDWSSNEFITYRVIIDYPVIPSTAIMRSLLPDRK
ncbi:MAG: hypothetical protein R6U39_00315 [Candidatus Aegiribacteria sp.]